jgi:hypothetical protein
MSDFRPMTECKGFNMERVLLKNKNGYMITAYFKDGMLQCDGDEDWTQPIAWSGFIRLHDLANGADTSANTLPIQNVSGAKRKVCPVCKKSFEKGWGEFCSQDCWDTDM